jgi:hypothetical protein
MDRSRQDAVRSATYPQPRIGADGAYPPPPTPFVCARAVALRTKNRKPKIRGSRTSEPPVGLVDKATLVRDNRPHLSVGSASE